MDKRTLIAIFLSFLVLVVYNNLVKKPSLKNQVVKSDTSVENYVEASGINEAPVFNEKSDFSKTSDVKKVSEELQSIKTDQYELTFSNLGGNLKNIKFLPNDKSMSTLNNLFSISAFNDQSYILESKSEVDVVYRLKNKEIEILKTYRIDQNDSHLINIELEIKNNTYMSNDLNLAITGLELDSSRLDNLKEIGRDKTLYEYVINESDKMQRKGNAVTFSAKEEKTVEKQVKWIGLRNKYNCVIIKPEQLVKKYNINVLNKSKLNIELAMQNVKIGPREKIHLRSQVFIGSQDLTLLKKYRQEEFEKIMVFSNWPILDAISKTIYNVLLFVNKVVPNWGLCIIIICFLIYGVTYPLTLKGLSSMKRMQVVQPEMNALKQKYKESPEKLNKEMMVLYKKHKINPFGGCLPLLLQMPIFIGLYQVLWRAEFFRGEGFLWIKDLSQPDRLLTFSGKLPLIGNELNILPIMMMVVMFFQQKISAKNMSTADPNQAAQQKMMTMFLPVFIGVIFYKFSSGLSLYFTLFYLLSTMTQLKMSKMSKVA